MNLPFQGMKTLFGNLEKRSTGFLVDDLTLRYYAAYTTDEQHSQLAEAKKTPIRLDGGELAYGILVRDELVYNYFKKYATDNWFQLDICRKNLLNYQMNKTKAAGEKDLPSVFSTDGGLFLPTLYSCLVLLFVSLVVGFAYEYWKRKTGRDISP